MWEEHSTRSDVPDDDVIGRHLRETAAEIAVLRLRARGATDAEITDALGLKFTTLRSRVRRFGDRTGLSHLRLVAWCATHIDCCLAELV